MNIRDALLALATPKMALKAQVAKVRAEFSMVEGRFEALESRIADLADRFSRFQNRENMRRARAGDDADQKLAEQAASILEQSSPTTSDSLQAKLDLWKRSH